MALSSGSSSVTHGTGTEPWGRHCPLCAPPHAVPPPTPWVPLSPRCPPPPPPPQGSRCPHAVPTLSPQAQLAFLQGERKGQENLKTDLVRRIKMLEFALKQERCWGGGDTGTLNCHCHPPPSSSSSPMSHQRPPPLPPLRSKYHKLKFGTEPPPMERKVEVMEMGERLGGGVGDTAEGHHGSLWVSVGHCHPSPAPNGPGEVAALEGGTAVWKDGRQLLRQ